LEIAGFFIFYNFLQDIDQMQELCSVAARLTPGYIMADLSLLVRETALEAHRGTDRNWLKSMYSMLAKMKPATLRGGLGVVTTEPMSMDQIGGLTEIKMKLKTVIEWPLLYPSAFQRMGILRPKGL
jgi:transitional endoplasmic reticulum ATPase